MEKKMDVFVKPINLDLENDFVCKFIALLGVRGSGKSNSVGVLAENFLDNRVSLTICDIEGEYFGLKERFELLVVGGANADIPLVVQNGRLLANLVLENNISIILDLSETLKEERNQFLLDYFDELWHIEHKFRKVHTIIIEEAHEFIPQSIKSDLKECLERIALRGRKWGLGAVIVSQRSAKVEKNILSQAEMYFLHKVTHPADFGIYTDLTMKTKSDLSKELSNFKIGDVFFKYNGKVEKLKVRKRKTFHAGYTPKLSDNNVVPDLKKLSEELIKTFKDATKQAVEEKTEIERLEQRIKQKNSEILEFQKKINDIELQLKVLGNLKVSMDFPSEQFIERTVINTLQASGVEISNPKSNPNPSQSFAPIKRLSFDYGEAYMEGVERIKQVFTSAKKIEVNILRVLQAKYPDELTVREIADRIPWSASTVASNRPDVLMKHKIIVRRRGDKAEYLYHSELRNYVDEMMEIYREDLSDEDMDEIFEYLLGYINYLSKE